MLCLPSCGHSVCSQCLYKNEKTLELDEIMGIVDKIIEAVVKKYNAVLRDK